MQPLQSEQLYYLHDTLTLFMVCIWLTIVYLGLALDNNKYKTYISYGLISFAIIQEIKKLPLLNEALYQLILVHVQYVQDMRLRTHSR